MTGLPSIYIIRLHDSLHVDYSKYLYVLGKGSAERTYIHTFSTVDAFWGFWNFSLFFVSGFWPYGSKNTQAQLTSKGHSYSYVVHHG